MKTLLAFPAAALLFVGCSTTPQQNGACEYKTVSGKVIGKEEPQLSSLINAEVSDGWQFVTAGQAADRWGFAVMKREKK